MEVAIFNSPELKKFALECGADAVGIAPTTRFEGAPPEMDPRLVFPGAKSVIGLIFRIPRGYIRGIEEGTNFYHYPSLGYAAINEDAAPLVLYNVGRYIEDNGYEAAVFRNAGARGPISDIDGKPGHHASPEEHRRTCLYTTPTRPGRPAPDILIHFRIAAYLCGLGEIGYSKMFLTPQFGPLNRQAFILTDAELEPDPIYEGPPLCDRCMACAAACPGKCISDKERISVSLAGRKVEWGKLNEWDCFIYYQGAARRSNPFLPADAFRGLPGPESIEAGKKHIGPAEFDAIAGRLSTHYPPALYGYNPPKCGGCLRACASRLEKRKRLLNRFKNPLRTGAPWNAGGG